MPVINHIEYICLSKAKSRPPNLQRLFFRSSSCFEGNDHQGRSLMEYLIYIQQNAQEKVRKAMWHDCKYFFHMIDALSYSLHTLTSTSLSHFYFTCRVGPWRTVPTTPCLCTAKPFGNNSWRGTTTRRTWPSTPTSIRSSTTTTSSPSPSSGLRSRGIVSYDIS